MQLKTLILCLVLVCSASLSAPSTLWAQTTAPLADNATTTVNVNEDDKKGINHKNLTNYEATRNFFVKIQQDIEEPFKESSLKMYKFDLQKAVNFPLNSMLEDKCSDDNRRNFIEKIKTLIRLLNGYVKFYSCFK